ncbi:MAG TPA: phytanoyl-CoA dioxygenase family protein [Planctomycetota bacterium]|nr:phytanoyl-CoA dioxygenase family protein [Planctomycetota bacterium]
MTPIDRERYRRDGFVLVDVLAPAEALALRQRIDEVIDRHRVGGGAVDRSFHASQHQHLGDRLATYGTAAKHYYFHLLTEPAFLPIQSVFHRPEILDAIGQLLDGGPLIIDNASLFAAEPGTCYRLPWHRDVIQIPQREIDEEALFTPTRFHNNVQINLPLHEDETLWVVPGSHRRPNTAAEDAAFAGSKHYAPLAAEMPGGVNVRIGAGQAVLYDNNIIHRGWNERFARPRRSLHLGYHDASRPPTWHFYLLDESSFTPAYLARMEPEVRRMIDAYFACRKRYPRIEDTWRSLRQATGPTPQV